MCSPLVLLRDKTIPCIKPLLLSYSSLNLRRFEALRVEAPLPWSTGLSTLSGQGVFKSVATDPTGCLCNEDYSCHTMRSPGGCMLSLEPRALGKGGLTPQASSLVWAHQSLRCLSAKHLHNIQHSFSNHHLLSAHSHTSPFCE